MTRPTDDLRAGSGWDAAVDGQFVREFGAGTVADEAVARYLVADRALVDTLTGVFGRALAQAPPDSRAPLAEFLGVITDEEDDYFERALAALPAPSGDPARHPTVEAFRDHLLAAADDGGYAETLAVLVPAEWCYLDWADGVERLPEPFYLREWVALHANDEFAAFVDWLRGELDREFETLSPRRADRVRRRFERTVQLEADFFAAASGG